MALFCAILSGSTPVLGLDPIRAGDELVRELWGIGNGLPEGAVLSIIETSDGYLWLGTESAIARFDGHGFDIVEPGEGGVPQYSHASDMVEDSRGRIWSALAGGLGFWDGSSLGVMGRGRGLVHPFVSAVATGSDGSIWVGTGGGGLWKYEDDVFLRYSTDGSSLLPGQINDLLLDHEGELWLATDDGVFVVGGEGVRAVSRGLPSLVVSSLARDTDGRIWAGTRRGLAGIDNGAFVPHPEIEGDVTALLEDKEKGLWVGTRSGRLFHSHGDRSAQLNIGSDTTRGGVFALALDSQGSLWVGTQNGLERYREGAFLTLSPRRGFSHEQIFSIAARRTGGLWVLDAMGAVYIFDDGRARQVASPGTIAGEGMLGMVETGDGSLWIGGRQLHRLRDGRVKSFPTREGGFSVIIRDGERLLVAQTGAEGRSRLSHFADGRLEPLPVDVPLIHVQRLLRDARGQLWISTGGNGLVRVGPDGHRTFTTREGLPDDIVYGILEGNGGKMWIATRGGLACIDQDKVISLASVDGVPNRATLHIQLDNLGYFWIASEEGIHRIAAEELEAVLDGRSQRVDSRIFSTRDGLRTNTVSWRCSAQARTPDGRLWYATHRGLAVVDPANVADPSVPPRVEIVGARLAGRPASFATDLSVLEGRERIDIHYTAPVLIQGDTVEFRYRLDGYDRDWIDVGTGRTAHYTNPPPGDFIFRVAGRHPEGEWGPEASLPLTIKPLWYETLVARTLFVLALLAIALGLHALRLRSHVRREQRLLDRVDERTKELAREVAERRRAEESVRQLNEDLEEKVRERTTQLSDANRALAADIAERRRAESALAEEKERLAVTLASLAEGVITTDIDSRVVSLNEVAEELVEWSSEEACGRQLSEVFAPFKGAGRQQLPSLVSKALIDGKRLELTEPTKLDGQGGREVVVEASAAPIHDRQGSVVGAVLVARDVTVRVRTEEQLRHTEKLEGVGILAAGIAHDFNNLLTGVLGHIDLARSSVDLESGVWTRLGEVLEVLDNARGLARQLLTFSAGGQPTVEPHSLGQLLRRSSRFIFSGAAVQVHLDISEDLWSCEIDPIQIRQTVDNLLINARQAMPIGGHVQVDARNVELSEGEDPGPGRYVELVIADDGPGMADDVREQAFDVFFTTKSTGTGLGLATSRSIIAQHRGTIDLESAPGQGSRFRILLPATERVPVSREVPISDTSATAPVKILIMDDDPTIREVTRSMLELFGHNVEVASEGGEAVSIIEQSMKQNQPFDLAILDLTIPGGMGGKEAATKLRPLHPELRVIASSGYSIGLETGDPDAHGFDAVLPKPYAMADLLSSVKSALGKPN